MLAPTLLGRTSSLMEATALVEEMFGMVCTGFRNPYHKDNAEKARVLPCLLPHGLRGVSAGFRIYFDRTVTTKRG